MHGINQRAKRATKRSLRPERKYGVKDCIQPSTGNVAAPRKGLRFFPPRQSETQKWKPSCRILGPPKQKEDGRKGLRVCKAPVAGSYHRPERVHFPGSLDGTKEAPRGIEDELGKRQRVFGVDGVEIRMRKSGFDSFEDSLGRKRRLETMLERRNGIPAARLGDRLYSTPTAHPLFFKMVDHPIITTRKNGGGVIPGSNWGFARATESRREDAKIFGRELNQLWLRNPKVPKVVLSCCEAMEEGGVVPGLFGCRASSDSDAAMDARGNFLVDASEFGSEKRREKLVRKMRSRVDRDQDHMIDWHQVCHDDPYAVATLLKEFFCELTSPLVPYHSFDRFVEASALENIIERVASLRTSVTSMPPANQKVLAYTVRFFLRLLNPELAEQNKLTIDSIADVFGPIFLRPLGHKIGDDHVVEQDKARACLREMLGKNSREIFQSVSLREYNGTATKRVPYAVKVLKGRAQVDMDSVASLTEWEVKSGYGMGLGEDDDEVEEAKATDDGGGD